MSKPRQSCSDEKGALVEPHTPVCKGRPGGDVRLLLDAILWIGTTGSPWRDLPAFFGNWNHVDQRFACWCDKSAKALPAGKGHDSNAVAELALDGGMEATIPSRSNRKLPRPLDRARYLARHLVENLFQRMKIFRRVATRFESLNGRFMGFVHIAGIMKWIHCALSQQPLSHL